MNMIDPRTEITHQIRAGQYYVDARSDEKLHLVYLDDDHVLLKDESKNARLEPRQSFDTNVGAGRYQVDGEVEVNADVAFTAIDFTRVPGVGNVAASSLQKNGYRTAEDIHRADSDELLAIRGIGEGNLENIRSYVEDMK